MASGSPTHNFGHIQDDDCGLEPNPKTGDQTARNEEAQAMGSNLKNDTCDVDEAANDDGDPTTDQFRTVPGNESTEKGTGRQDGDNQRLMRAGERRGTGAFYDLDEHLGSQDPIDVPAIEPEEDTPERSKRADEVGFPRHRRLDLVDVAGGREGRHCERPDKRLDLMETRIQQR